MGFQYYMSKLLAVVTVTLTFPSASAWAQEQPLQLSLGIMDDRLNAVPGASFQIVVLDTAATHTATTGRDGYSPLVELSTGIAVGMILAETATANGVCLGQYHEWSLGPAGGSEVHLAHRVLFQPSLEPVTITYSQPTLPDTHLRWTFIPSEHAKQTAPEFSFASQVGPLLTSHEIRGYEGFYGVDFGPVGAEAKLGLVIRTSSIDLGQLNLALKMDVRGHEFSSLPQAHTFVLHDPGPLGTPTTPPTFSATAFEINDGHVYLRLTGALERGDNVILLTPGGPSQAPLRLPTSRLNMSIPASASAPDPPPAGPQCEGTDSDPGAVKQPRCNSFNSENACTPADPASCDGPAIPSSSLICSAYTVGGPRSCGTSGGQDLRTSVTVTGSVSVGFKVDLGIFEGNASATGSVALSQTIVASVDLDPGNTGCLACSGSDACGQCVRLCLEIATCSQSFTIKVRSEKVVTEWIEAGSHTVPHSYTVPGPCDKTVGNIKRSCFLFIGSNQAVCMRSCP